MLETFSIVNTALFYVSIYFHSLKAIETKTNRYTHAHTHTHSHTHTNTNTHTNTRARVHTRTQTHTHTHTQRNRSLIKVSINYIMCILDGTTCIGECLFYLQCKFSDIVHCSVVMFIHIATFHCWVYFKKYIIFRI